MPEPTADQFYSGATAPDHPHRHPLALSVGRRNADAGTAVTFPHPLGFVVARGALSHDEVSRRFDAVIEHGGSQDDNSEAGARIFPSATVSSCHCGGGGGWMSEDLAGDDRECLSRCGWHMNKGSWRKFPTGM